MSALAMTDLDDFVAHYNPANRHALRVKMYRLSVVCLALGSPVRPGLTLRRRRSRAVHGQRPAP
jgi:hypothetical protein